MDKSKIAAGIFNKYAVQYQDKFMDVSLYHDSFDLFCNSIVQQNAAILELACGPGNITKYLLERRPDFNLLGIDLSENMLELAKANNPTATFELMDCREISNLHNKYDGIMCGFCLPYLSKEEALQLITDTADMLHRGGILYISTMEDEYSKSGIERSSGGDEMYMHYHEAGYLLQALEENDFSIINIQRKSYPKSDGTTVNDLLLIARINAV